jgi:hypothetical protein
MSVTPAADGGVDSGYPPLRSWNARLSPACRRGSARVSGTYPSEVHRRGPGSGRPSGGRRATSGRTGRRRPRSSPVRGPTRQRTRDRTDASGRPPLGPRLRNPGPVVQLRQSARRPARNHHETPLSFGRPPLGGTEQVVASGDGRTQAALVGRSVHRPVGRGTVPPPPTRWSRPARAGVAETDRGEVPVRRRYATVLGWSPGPPDLEQHRACGVPAWRLSADAWPRAGSRPRPAWPMAAVAAAPEASQARARHQRFGGRLVGSQALNQS